MLCIVWWWLCCDLCSSVVGQAEAQSPVEPSERSRPYAVLRGQNLGERPRAAGSGLRSRLWGGQLEPGARGAGCGGRGRAAAPVRPPFQRPELYRSAARPGTQRQALDRCWLQE